MGRGAINNNLLSYRLREPRASAARETAYESQGLITHCRPCVGVNYWFVEPVCKTGPLDGEFNSLAAHMCKSELNTEVEEAIHGAFAAYGFPDPDDREGINEWVEAAASVVLSRLFRVALDDLGLEEGPGSGLFDELM